MNTFVALDNLLSIIDNCDADESLLQRIGVDDVAYRMLSEMVIAQSGHTEEHGPLPGMARSVRAVDIICDYITNNVGFPLTISKMEKMVGVSGRALNYAFQQRFSCSPQEWQRGFLLDEARRRLSRTDQCDSIKTVAYELGFSSSSSFTSHYKRRFGELPSETIRLTSK